MALPKSLKYVQPGLGNPGKRHKEILDFMDEVLGIAQKPNIKYVQPGQVFSVCNVFFKYYQVVKYLPCNSEFTSSQEE